MSADNWDICPKCLTEATAKAERKSASVSKLYGTVPVDEFDRRRAELKPVEREDYRTFREDYEFYGADEAYVEASYRGSCSKCGLSVKLTARKDFWPESRGGSR